MGWGSQFSIPTDKFNAVHLGKKNPGRHAGICNNIRFTLIAASGARTGRGWPMARWATAKGRFTNIGAGRIWSTQELVATEQLLFPTNSAFGARIQSGTAIVGGAWKANPAAGNPPDGGIVSDGGACTGMLETSLTAPPPGAKGGDGLQRGSACSIPRVTPVRRDTPRQRGLEYIGRSRSR